MKKYTSSKKIDRPYFNFSEMLGFPILPLCGIAFVSYLIMFFFGLGVMLTANTILAVILTFIYHGLKNSSPNGSSSLRYFSLESFILNVLPSFFVILGVLLIVNIGGYIIVTFQHTGVFYDTYFYIWLFVLFVIPAVYFMVLELKYHLQLYYQAHQFTPLRLAIMRDYELLTADIRVTILHTKKKLCSEQAVGIPQDTDHIGELNRMTVTDKNGCLYKPLFHETIDIPKDADRFVISWYSAIEDMYYNEEIDFPFDKLVYAPNPYPLDVSPFLRGKKTDRVTLSILQGGKIKLFNKHQDLLDCTIKSVAISEEKKKQQAETVASIYSVKNLPVLINKIKQSHGIDKRAELSEYTCSWQVSGTGLEEHNVEIKDVRHHYTTSAPIVLNTFEPRRLPIFFEIDHRKTVWLYVHIDAEKLYDVVTNLEDKDPKITFDFTLNAEKGAANLVVKNKDRVIPFTAWEKKIDEYRLKELKEYFLKNKDQIIKNNFLKEIGECIIAKDYAATAELCKTALKTYPYFPMVYFYEARLLWYNEGFEASYAKEEYFIGKTKTDPYALAQIYNHYGCLYDEEKRYAEALVYFEKAYDTYPDMLYYLANIAEIHYKLKHAEKAVHYAQECVKKECTLDIITEIIANKGMIKNG